MTTTRLDTVKAAPEAPGAREPVAAVVIAEDEIRRRRLGSALLAAGIPVAAQASRPEELAGPLDLVVVGLDALDPQGLGLVATIRARVHGAAVLVVTGEVREFAARRAIDRGIDGFVLESRLDETLAAAVAGVRAGLLVLPGELRSHAGMPALSAREKQVLGMVVMGYTNGEIARGLHVVEATVKSHLSSAFRKLGVRSRSQATALILDPQSGLGLGILRLSDEDG